MLTEHSFNANYNKQSKNEGIFANEVEWNDDDMNDDQNGNVESGTNQHDHCIDMTAKTSKATEDTSDSASMSVDRDLQTENDLNWQKPTHQTFGQINPTNNLNTV